MTLFDQHINDIEIKSYINAIMSIANDKSWCKDKRKHQIYGVEIAATYDTRISTTQLEMIHRTTTTFIETLNE